MSNFNIVTGRGVAGTVNGKTYQVGRPERVAEQNLEMPSLLRSSLGEADERGESAVVLMDDRRAVAVIAMADQVRERARETIRH